MGTTEAFIIDCSSCKAKVAAAEVGRAERTWQAVTDEGDFAQGGQRLLIGRCPACGTLLVGESRRSEIFEEGDIHLLWSDAVRVFPSPPKTFESSRIPNVVKASLIEADRSLQANANLAACVMLGRALEALCRDVLKDSISLGDKKLMLGEGIKQLRNHKIIDERLFEWGLKLQQHRNLAAHPEDVTITSEDATDLQSFIYAIVEYVYDLTDRHEEFKRRIAGRL
jgi:hypothetical protein